MVRLGAGWQIELRWWWEESPPDKPMLERDPIEARAYFASMCAHQELAIRLRSFLREGSPWQWSPPDDGELIERLTAAVATGQVKIAKIPAPALPSWDEQREEEPAAPVARAPLLPPIAEEVCWPCLRAAASARALREASADGSPFVAEL